MSAGCSVLTTPMRAFDYAGRGFVYERDGAPTLVLIKFGHLPQPDGNSCGPACLASVLVHYRDEGGGAWRELMDEMRAHHDGRWSLDELKSFAQGEGEHAFVVRADLDGLRSWIDRGWPPLVPMPVPGDVIGSERHMVTLVGYDDARGFVVTADPLVGGFYQYEYEEFGRRWARADNAALVVVPGSSVQDQSMDGEAEPPSQIVRDEPGDQT